jgi:glycosyltransferase involved in cell wall biosynthesis
MIRVAVLTSGRRQPSSRFRVRQHIGVLAELGVEVTELRPRIGKYRRLPGWPRGLRQGYAGPLLLAWNVVKLATRLPGIVGSWKHQVTWLQRDLLPGFPTLEGWLKGPLVFDIDDAVWLLPPLGALAIRRIAQRSEVVVAGNPYLADYFTPHCRDVRVIPTAIDTRRFHPASTGGGERPFTIGWTGLATNLPYLRQIAAPLYRFLDAHRDARLLLMADAPPRFELAPPGQMELRPWSEAAEVAGVQEMDVGLMPLPETPWTLGKCSFKMLQYMACAVPVIASPVGMNADVLALGEIGLGASTGDEWYEALEHLYQDRDRARRYGLKGRALARRHFDRDIVARQLAGVFHDLGGA